MLKRTSAAVGVFAAANCCLLFAGFIAPYVPTEQHREFAYAPPVRLHFVDQNGRLHLQPFVYGIRLSDAD
jgi:hypothetical protein